MENISEKQRREIVVQFHMENSVRGKCYTINYFMRMKVKSHTLYGILGRYEKRKTTKRKRGSGRPAQKLTASKRRRVRQVANNKKGVNHRKLAAKCNVSRAYIGKVLRSQNVKYFRRQKCPDSTPEQQIRQIKCLRSMNRKLYPPTSDVAIILDDESYFPPKHDEMPGNCGFYSDNKKNTPFRVKYKPKQKFARLAGLIIDQEIQANRNYGSWCAEMGIRYSLESHNFGWKQIYDIYAKFHKTDKFSLSYK